LSETVHQLLHQAYRVLAGVETARLDAELLLACVLGARRETLYAHPEREVPEIMIGAFRKMIDERRMLQPVAYLTGRREFWSLDLKVNPDTLIPRPETELLVAAALERIPEQAAWRLLDLGTGCGAIALAIAAERPRCEVYATDISQAALTIAESNRKAYHLQNVHLRQADWLNGFAEEPFHMILSNPPYLASDDAALHEGETRFEPRLALDGGERGLERIRQIIPSAGVFLEFGGYLLLEHGCDQGAAVRSLLSASGYRDPVSLCDLAGHERVSLGQSA